MIYNKFDNQTIREEENIMSNISILTIITNCLSSLSLGSNYSRTIINYGNFSMDNIDVFHYDDENLLHDHLKDTALTYDANNGNNKDGRVEFYTYVLKIINTNRSDKNYYVVLKEMSFTPTTYKGGFLNLYTYLNVFKSIGIKWESSSNISFIGGEVGSCASNSSIVNLSINLISLFDSNYSIEEATITGQYELPFILFSNLLTVTNSNNSSTYTISYKNKDNQNKLSFYSNVSKYSFYSLIVLSYTPGSQGYIRANTSFSYYHGAQSKNITNASTIDYSDYFTIEF